MPINQCSYSTCTVLLSGKHPACPVFSSCWESSKANSSIPLSRATHSLFPSCTGLRQCSPHISTEPLTDRWAQVRDFGQWEFRVMRCGSHEADSNITMEFFLEHNTADSWSAVLAKEKKRTTSQGCVPYTQCTWLVWAQPAGTAQKVWNDPLHWTAPKSPSVMQVWNGSKHLGKEK